MHKQLMWLFATNLKIAELCTQRELERFLQRSRPHCHQFKSAGLSTLCIVLARRSCRNREGKHTPLLAGNIWAETLYPRVLDSRRIVRCNESFKLTSTFPCHWARLPLLDIMKITITHGHFQQKCFRVNRKEEVVSSKYIIEFSQRKYTLMIALF